MAEEVISSNTDEALSKLHQNYGRELVRQRHHGRPGGHVPSHAVGIEEMMRSREW